MTAVQPICPHRKANRRESRDLSTTLRCAFSPWRSCGALELPEALLSVLAAANTSLLQRWEVEHLLLECLDCEGPVVMVDVEGWHDRLSFDPHGAAVGLDHRCDVLAERLQSGEPRCFEDSWRDEVVPRHRRHSLR